MKFWVQRRVWPGVIVSLAFILGAHTSAAQRTVFAHYMLANADYQADSENPEKNITLYEREIRQAQAVGIDGFALNAGGWFREPRYIRRASEMFEAAYRLHTGFKLMFSADMCCSNDAADVMDMVRRFANKERYSAIYFKEDGKAVLTTFAGSSHGAKFWQELKKDMEQGTELSLRTAPNAVDYASGIPSSVPLPIFLVTSFFWGGETPAASDIRSGLDEYSKTVDGSFYWGIAGVPGIGHTPDQIPSSDAYASVLHGAGKLYMAPICFQFWGANAGRYYEYSGYSGMRAMWMDAINVSHPEWVEIITWNDFVEGTYVSPIDDPARYAGANDLDASVAPASTLGLFHSHRGATELLRYFIAWYKTGRQPAIQTDTVFWAYRTEIAVQPHDRKQSIKVHGPVADVLYITANLTSPAELRVTIGVVSKSVALAAGSNDVQVPLVAGSTPRFQLMRAGRSLAEAGGDDPISQSGQYPDLYYSTGSMHD